jgi:hypothetical protein
MTGCKANFHLDVTPGSREKINVFVLSWFVPDTFDPSSAAQADLTPPTSQRTSVRKVKLAVATVFRGGSDARGQRRRRGTQDGGRSRGRGAGAGHRATENLHPHIKNIFSGIPL